MNRQGEQHEPHDRRMADSMTHEELMGAIDELVGDRVSYFVGREDWRHAPRDTNLASRVEVEWTVGAFLDVDSREITRGYGRTAIEALESFRVAIEAAEGGVAREDRSEL